jgi:hypothetical protein
MQTFIRQIPRRPTPPANLSGDRRHVLSGHDAAAFGRAFA